MIVVLLCTTTILFGQQSAFLAKVNESSLQLTSAEQTSKANIGKLPYAQDVKIVSVADFVGKQTDGIINFTLPGIAKQFSAEVIHIEYTSDKDYTWTGKFTNAEGYMSIINKDDYVIGVFTSRNRVLLPTSL